jgi:methionyl-tRNA formyltransferase
VILPNQTTKQILKIFETEKEFAKHDFALGTLVTDGKKYAKIALSDGFIILKSVQIAGKKRMDIGELLHGMR